MEYRTVEYYGGSLAKLTDFLHYCALHPMNILIFIMSYEFQCEN